MDRYIALDTAQHVRRAIKEAQACGIPALLLVTQGDLLEVLAVEIHDEQPPHAHDIVVGALDGRTVNIRFNDTSDTVAVNVA